MHRGSAPLPVVSASPRLLPRRGSMSGSVSSVLPPLPSARISSGDLAAVSAGSAASSTPASSSPSSSVARPAGWFDSSAPIRLDITFETASHHGSQATQLTRVAVGMNPSLAPLVLTLKHLLAAHGLNDAFSGGLSSFGLLVLTSSFLAQAQHEMPHILQGTRYAVPSQGVMNVPEVPLQPYSDGRPFSEIVAPYAMLPPELCGSVQDLHHFMLLPLAMPRLPPVLPPHVRVTRVPRTSSHTGSPQAAPATVSALSQRCWYASTQSGRCDNGSVAERSFGDRR